MPDRIDETFCKTLPTQPFIWDPSRLRVAMNCWRKHWLQTVRGLRWASSASIHQEWGSAYHLAVETFDRALLSKLDREAATEMALQTAFSESWDEERKQLKWGEWVKLFRCSDPEKRPHKKHPEHMVKNRVRCSYARTWAPLEVLGVHAEQFGRCGECNRPLLTQEVWVPAHAKKTRENLLRAVALYCDSSAGVRPYNFPNGLPAVEVQARVPLPLQSPNGGPYELLVNIDSIVEWEGVPAIRERKTTGMALDASYWRQFELDPQIDTYDLVGTVLYTADDGRPPKIMVEATRIGAKNVEIVRHPIHITEERRAEWLEEVMCIIEEAEQRAKRLVREKPESAFPRNTTACHGRFGTCPFFALCSVSASEREAIIEADYVVNRWDPVKACSILEGEE